MIANPEHGPVVKRMHALLEGEFGPMQPAGPGQPMKRKVKLE